jgi:hypothetical protein
MSLPVTDPFGVLTDEQMPFLHAALDSSIAQKQLAELCGAWPGTPRPVKLRGIRVIRYKPGRRCLIEYEMVSQVAIAKPLILLGKVRANGLDRKTFELQRTLWQGGFGPSSEEGVRVPEPVGIIPQFQMWLQAKAPGAPATELLANPGAAQLARRIAEALHKLHFANIPASRTHCISDELQILRKRLDLVAQNKPEWRQRLERLLAACERLGASLPAAATTGIHRDFYPAQILVDGTTLYLLDFDLFCRGNPALDAGNFLGHLLEHSLRESNNACALSESRSAFLERFVELSGLDSREAVEAYTTLTLVRHIHLSTLFPERAPFTERIMAECEQRLRSLLG